jgi:hypothetical protein
MLPFKVTAVVLCDDIRQEQNNKFILIGVYNGTIVVQDYPTETPVSWWIQVQPEKPGKFKINLRLTKEDSSTLLKGELGIELNSIGWSALAIPKVVLHLQNDGKLKLQLKLEEDEEWETIQEIIITKNPSPNPSPSA